LEDFVECLLTGREPDSGLELAFQTVEAIYAAYLSAEKGMRVELEKRPPLTT
jgi:predicted dehydrogenase